MEPFKVAIVGGSIAGLTVALHLERLGIDWILIERHPEIAPQLGASIALNPNGLSVLSQLGCVADIDVRCQAMQVATVRTGNGGILKTFQVEDRIRSRFGWDVYFTERQVLVETLFRRIRDKQNIVTGQKVTKIHHTDQGNKVHILTEEGGTFTADMVVGADGIHSPVRSAMWQMAAEEDPSVFGDNPASSIRTEFGCVFGISHPTNTLEAGEAIQVHGKGLQVGTLLGPKGVVYWFVIFAYPTPLRGLDLPRYTLDDEAQMIARASDIVIKPGTTFADVYKNKTMSYMTPLPDGTFDRWHYKRVICIGDSAHKMNPITGQGGCMALESGVALVDSIYAALKQNNHQPLSTDAVEKVFERVTESRKKRVVSVAEESMQAIRFGTWANSILWLLDNYLLWLIPTNLMVGIMVASCYNGYVSNSLPPPVHKYKMTGAAESQASHATNYDEKGGVASKAG